MKKLVLGLFVTLGIISSPSFAGCWMEKVGPLKTKVCNPGDSPSGAVKTMYDDLKDTVVKKWHNIYGVVPEWGRDFFNQHTLEIIGLYLNGIPGGFVGRVLTDVYMSIETTITAASKAYEQGLPAFVTISIFQIGDIAATQNAYVGEQYAKDEANYSRLVRFILDQQNLYNTRVRGASNEAEARRLVKEFRNLVEQETGY